jgi:alanine racemase
MHCWIEISESCLLNNINIIKYFAKNKEIGAVLKGNAYGHGADIISNLLEKNKSVKYIFIANENEIKKIIDGGWTGKIIIMSPNLDYFIENHNIEYTIYSFESLELLNKLTKKINRKINIHIKIDTGMSRLGFLENEIDKLINILKDLKNINIISTFSHCFNSYAYETIDSQKQADIFEKSFIKLQNNFKNIKSHIFASGSIDIENNFDIIRAGSSFYGLWKSDEHKKRIHYINKNLNFKQILTLKSKVIQIKNVPAGTMIGYAGNQISSTDKTVAIISIGYSDGYNRDLSNKTGVYINNSYAPICGIIGMNLTCIDITNIKNINIGTEVTLCSGNIDDISIINLAKKINTIPINFTTSLSNDLKRIIIE